MYFFGLLSFRASVGLLLRCLWSVSVSASAVPRMLCAFPGGLCFGCFAVSIVGSFSGLPALVGCFAALPGVVFRPLWAFILFCGFFFVCGPFFVLWAFGCFAAFGPGGSVLFWAWLWCMFSAVFARWRLGIICPSFFRVPFGILCGFFCCHCPVLPAAVVVRLSFSAWACILLYMAFNGSIL